MTKIIEAIKISKNYSELKALDNVSIEVHKGTIHGLLGPNGAGKTTLIKILTTLIKPDLGEVFIDGIEVLKHPEQVRKMIGLSGQYSAVDEHLTANENLSLFGNLYHMEARKVKERTKELLHSFNLEDAANRPLKTFSGGMRRRLDLAVSLIAEPKIVFLDEPTTGLDPKSRNDLWQIILELVENGTTILLTTQYLEEADYLAEEISVINKGKLVAQGTSQDLKKKVGKEFLDINLQNIEDFKKAEKILDEIDLKFESREKEDFNILIKTSDISGDILKALSAFEKANLKVKDLDTRKPTLDDVFLMVTNE